MVWNREISTKVEQGQSMDSQLVRAVTQRLPFKVYVKTRWSRPYSVDPKKSCKCKNKGPIQGSFMTWSVLQMWSNKKGHRAQIKTCRQNQKKSSTFTGAWPHTVLYNISLLEIKKTKRLAICTMWFNRLDYSPPLDQQTSRKGSPCPFGELGFTFALLVKQWTHRICIPFPPGRHVSAPAGRDGTRPGWCFAPSLL